MSSNVSANIPRPGLDLEYPMSLGVYDSYEQAQKVGVEGRSDMSKDDLIDALRNH